MPQINAREYTLAERKRHGAAFYRLQEIIVSDAPDAEKFRRVLGQELAAGFPIDWPARSSGWTLLHRTAFYAPAIEAGLQQALIEAGADVNVNNEYGETPLGCACWNYSAEGAPGYLQAVETLLAAGARPELDEKWKKSCRAPDWRARRVWLEAYIKTWPERSAAAARAGEAFPDFDYAL